MNTPIAIPRGAPDRGRRLCSKPPRRPVVPSADRSVPVVVASWFCLPGVVEPATEFRPRRVYAPYCGAPSGYRCRCGAQLAGHDFGDEDVRP